MFDVAYAVFYPKRIEKAMEGLPPKVASSIRASIEGFAADPSGAKVDIRKLKGREREWSVRCGEYRAIIDIDQEAKLVTVLRVSDRKDAY